MPAPRQYQGHHDWENRIKELKLNLRMDKTSCEDFAAKQFRVLLSFAAALLLQVFQQKLPASTGWAGAQMATIRERLFKRAVRVTKSVRRIPWQFSRHYPWAQARQPMALAVGATGGQCSARVCFPEHFSQVCCLDQMWRLVEYSALTGQRLAVRRKSGLIIRPGHCHRLRFSRKLISDCLGTR